jgi:hypothetical protein
VVTFRYHLVSLAAVLMALAAGVVLGAGPLANAVSTAVGPTPTASAQAGSSAQTVALAQLQAAARYDDVVLAATANKVVRGTLAGNRVVLVVAAGASPDTVAATAALLQAAGATVTGQVLLTPAWTAADQATVLTGITDQLAPADTKVGDGTPAGNAAAALAAAVLATKAKDLGQTSDSATALLAGLQQGGFVTVKGTPGAAAGLAVLIGPTGPRSGAALVPIARALAAAGTGSVTAAPRGSASASGLVGAIRSDPATKAVVSTVDCVDLPAGRLATVLALARDHAGHHGQFGLGPAVDAPFPG